MIPDNETFDYIAHVTRQVYDERIKSLELIVSKLLTLAENQQMTINAIIQNLHPEFKNSEADKIMQKYAKTYGTESSEDYK